jgi:hypothetical protein
MNVGSHLSKRAQLNPGLEALVDDAAGLPRAMVAQRTPPRRIARPARHPPQSGRRVVLSHTDQTNTSDLCGHAVPPARE